MASTKKPAKNNIKKTSSQKTEAPFLGSFLQRLKNPKSSFRKRFFLVLLVILLVTAFLMAFETYRNLNLYSSLDSLKASIQASNITVSDRETECYDEINQLTDTKVGRSCRVIMTIRTGEIEPVEAQRIITTVYNVAGSVKDFERTGSAPTLGKEPYGINGTTLKHKSTGRSCGVGYFYEIERNNKTGNPSLWVNFRCDVTSWFRSKFGI